MASNPNPNIEIDFYSMLKRARKLHAFINTAYPRDYNVNLASLLFTYLLFKSGQVPLGEILKEVGNIHDFIMLHKGTGGLDTMLEELKLEEDKESNTDH